MDSFNPFENAWGDDTAVPGTSQDPAVSSSSAFKFPDEDRLPSITGNHINDASALESIPDFNEPAVVVNNDEDDAWGAVQPIASTSAAGLAADQWYTAPSTPPHRPEALASVNAEDSWQPSSLSAEVAASPPAWADIDTESQGRPSTHHEEEQENERSHSGNTRRSLDEKEEGGFGGFAEALPDLTAGETPQLQRESDTDWGATELPPSKWDNHLNAPPIWQTSDLGVEGSEAGVEGPSHDPWRPAKVRRGNIDDASSFDGASRGSVDGARLSEEAELDLERLQSELGIQIRNLDEEYAKQGKSPAISESSPTLPISKVNNTSKGSRWSIWGAKRSTSAMTSVEGEANSRRVSVDSKDATDPVESPRSSLSTAGIASPAASSSIFRTPDINSVSKQTPPVPGQDAQQQQASVSRFFRFGKGRASSIDPAASKNDSPVPSTTPATSKTATPTASHTKPAGEITDDFGQLENFDSRRSASANGTHVNSGASGYDDFRGVIGKEDDEPQRRRWFWDRNRVVDHSNEEEEEQDLDRVFSAFSVAPVTNTSASASTMNRVSSLRAEGRVSNRQGIVAGGKQDPFAHLSAVASSIRSSASVDPFDPLDPLAELNQVSNITATSFKDNPSPSMQSQSHTFSPPIPAPPSFSSRAGLTRPPSSPSILVLPTSGHVIASKTPPPLLAPPAPLSSISSSRKVSSPSSLLDDLADLTFSDGHSKFQAISSPASGPGPIVAQAPTAIRPSSTAKQPSIDMGEDDFGDFETATSVEEASQVASRRKASGPMVLSSKPAVIPPFVHSQSGSGTKKGDEDFFDLL